MRDDPGGRQGPEWGEGHFSPWVTTLLLVGFPLIQILLAGPIIEWGRRQGGRGWITLFSWIFAMEWSLFVVVIANLRAGGMTLLDIGWPRFGKAELWAYGTFMAVLVAVVLWVGDSSNTHVVQGPWILPRTVSEKLLMLGSAFTAGVCEETMFRGYLYHGLRRVGWPPAVAVGAATVSFVLIHGLEQPAALLVARAALGLAFALLYLWRGSLRLPILIHTVLDAQLAFAT
jgi:membrane protease YdiL (CAAX protease family)